MTCIALATFAHTPTHTPTRPDLPRLIGKLRIFVITSWHYVCCDKSEMGTLSTIGDALRDVGGGEVAARRIPFRLSFTWAGQLSLLGTFIHQTPSKACLLQENGRDT